MAMRSHPNHPEVAGARTDMSDFHSKLIQSYRLLSMPGRHLQFVRMSRRGVVPIFVLFFHRVADDHPNPWTMGCQVFEELIEWIQINFDVVDLQECQRRIHDGSNSRPTVAITFDDGYAENAEFALPMLIERRIPVTYFVTTHHTTNQQPFQHDVDRGAPLPANTIESLRALDLAGIEIGAHTRNHVDLAKITCEKTLVDEVIVASQELEKLIGRKIRYFAFPFGQIENLNPNVFAMLREAGFLGVCSAYGGWNDIGGDGFHIQRTHGDPNLERMKNWLTYDPRLARIPKYDYSAGTFDRSQLPDSKFSDPPEIAPPPFPRPGIPLPMSDTTIETMQFPTNSQ